jgi:replicative DNA helicase
MISDMRECLPIDEWVYTAGGPVQLGSRPSSVISSTASGVTENPCSYVPKRHNSVIEVVTQFGRFRVTPRHLVLTGTGYKQARHLQPGRDVVAAPNRIPHANRGALPHARLLGWLLGNGGLSGTPSLIYRDELDADVRAAVAAFGVDVKARKNQKCECVVDAYLSNGVESGCSPNPLMGWIRELGLEGKTAHDKSVPTTYLGSSDETHIDLLRGLWESDGTVTNGDAKYSTVNELLARQVAWLLLTVGVRSTVSLHDGLWTVRASTVDSARMSPIVNAPGRFGVLAEPDPARIDPAPQIFVDLAAELSTARRFQRRTDGTHKLICKRDMEAIVKWTPGLDTIARSPYMTTPGVGWGCVLEVRKQDKPVRVADLQVPGPNNFVASGMVVHNSGAIEQDADAIMLVYRDEYYYGQESKNKGIVEINVAKQRDGETGVRNLAWQGSYIRIANLDNHHDPEDVNDQHWSDR